MAFRQFLPMNATHTPNTQKKHRRFPPPKKVDLGSDSQDMGILGKKGGE